MAAAACAWTPPDTSSAGLHCVAGEMPCNGRCVDFATDPNNCGGCALPCGQTSLGQTQYCNDGFCTPAYDGTSSQCVPNGNACTFSGECCTLFCNDGGTCAPIPPGAPGCASDSNCMSGHCDSTSGVCQ